MRGFVLGGLLLMVSLVSVSPAYGQDFTLTASAFFPTSVDPNGQTSATITVDPVTAMTAPTVNLSCTVSSSTQVTTPPTCSIPSPVVAHAIPAVTVVANGATDATYTITVTGSDASGSVSVNLSLTVLPVIADYTLTVTTALAPTSLHAGAGATGVVTITPGAGYTGNITLSCSMVTPAVIPAPQCSFTPVPVVITASGAAQTATITVSTAGPATAQLRTPRMFYALWLLLPGLLLGGIGLGARRKKVLGWLLLGTLGISILLLPACGGSPATSTIPGTTGTTPNHTYTFTLTGVDTTGLAPSNTSPTMSLTVN